MEHVALGHESIEKGGADKHGLVMGQGVLSKLFGIASWFTTNQSDWESLNLMVHYPSPSCWTSN